MSSQISFVDFYLELCHLLLRKIKDRSFNSAEIWGLGFLEFKLICFFFFWHQ